MMSWLNVAPAVVADASAGLAGAGAAFEEVTQAGAAATTEILPAAIDEVSAMTSTFFSGHGAQFQLLSVSAQQIHQQLVQTLATAAGAYQQTEAAGMQSLWSGVGQLEQPLIPAIQQLLPWSANPTTIPTIPTGQPLGIAVGGTTYPLLSQTLINEASGSYFPKNLPVYPLFTPEQFWPLTPQLGNLTLGQSFAQGTQILGGAVQAQLAAGNPTTVFGVSQSATIVSNELKALLAQGAPGQGLLKFVLAGNPSNPDGGILERFVGGYIPGLDIPFSGATPTVPYSLSVYTAQYDGFADFPRYVLNPVSDLNAVAGALFVHGGAYATPAVVQTGMSLPSTVPNNQYYMMPTQNLPLLDPVRHLLPAPFGKTVADLLTPDVRVLADMGYGSGEYANLPTPASLLEFPRWDHIIPDLAHGTGQGIRAAGVDLGVLPQSDFPTGYPYTPVLDPQLNWPMPQTGVTGISRLTTFEGHLMQALGLEPAWDVQP